MKFTGSELISHHDKLMAYAYKRVPNRDDALDLVQHTYMKAIRYNQSFYRKDGINLGAWLMVILKNNLKDYYEKKAHNPQLTDTPYDDLVDTDLPPHFDEHHLGKVFKDEEIEAAFNNLTPYQKEVIYNTYILDIDDFAQSDNLGVNRRTLISRRKKGMDQLRKQLTGSKRKKSK